MKILTHYLPAAAFVLVCVLLAVWDAPIEMLTQLLSGMNFLSYVAYVLILASAVVFMPLTVMPIIPIAASILGPFVTSILSIVGWSLGSAIAFLLARYLGRPFLQKVIDVEKLDGFIDTFPKETHFWFIVLLRLTLPVDLVSYALGLTKSLRFSSYIAATVLGVSWFSFAFAYMGEAFFSGNTIVLVEIFLASVAVFVLGWFLLRRKKSDK